MSSLWCILSVKQSARTLALAKSLSDVGIEVWTPTKTLQHPKPGRYNGPRRTIEKDWPIVPSLVFARAIHVLDLFAIAKDPAARHPAFAMMHYGQRLPLVSESDIAGLRDAEQAALLAIERIRAADAEKAKEELRIAALRTEQARRKAMRAQRRTFEQGEQVQVTDAPAFVGMTGIIERSDGKSALVGFGGSLFVTVEAWQLLPIYVQGGYP